MEGGLAHDLIVVCRFVHAAAATFLWGAYGYLALLPAEIARPVADRLKGTRGLAVVAIAVALLLRLPAEGAMAAGSSAAGLDPAVLQTMLFQTTLGTSWLVAAVALCLLLLALRPAAGTFAVVAPAGLALASVVFTGHAMIAEGPEGLLQRCTDLVHVLSAGAWLGALVPLILLLGPAEGEGARLLQARSLDRFSRLGRLAVALTLLTGAVNTALIVGRLPLDPRSPYQMLLCVKIGLFLAMVAVASGNQWLILPRFRDDAAAAVAGVRRGACVEIGLGAAILGLVAVFGMLDPA